MVKILSPHDNLFYKKGSIFYYAIVFNSALPDFKFVFSVYKVRVTNPRKLETGSLVFGDDLRQLYFGISKTGFIRRKRRGMFRIMPNSFQMNADVSPVRDSGSLVFQFSARGSSNDWIKQMVEHLSSKRHLPFSEVTPTLLSEFTRLAKKHNRNRDD